MKDNSYRNTILAIIVIALSFLVIGILSGCDERRPQPDARLKVVENRTTDLDYLITEIDGCEYVVFRGGSNRGGICHKANCKNPIHEREKAAMPLAR